MAYTTPVTWEVEVTDEFTDWYVGLSQNQRQAVASRVDLLEEHGPKLKRPVVGEIKSSNFDPQMKELRCGTLRVLFAFDPERTAILLLGGDKSGRWTEWYREAIPAADALFEEYLNEKGLS
ncbi:MAG: type II toxin-antitoxin system RelE/ParE family toxin [Thermoleophilaceae bacterium]